VPLCSIEQRLGQSTVLLREGTFLIPCGRFAHEESTGTKVWIDQIVSVSGAGARMRGDRDSRRASTAVVPLALHIAGISSAGVRVRLVLVRPPDESGKACYDELSLVSLAKLTKGRIERCAGLHGLRASLESCS
jgi:hypothetical protein